MKITIYDHENQTLKTILNGVRDYWLEENSLCVEFKTGRESYYPLIHIKSFDVEKEKG